MMQWHRGKESANRQDLMRTLPSIKIKPASLSSQNSQWLLPTPGYKTYIQQN
ncbi:hypothetical protein Mapa_017003 [Marchantia paleacea]|nr:hypothetical protein Mapa_017003 [Marchantia paleacea]